MLPTSTYRYMGLNGALNADLQRRLNRTVLRLRVRPIYLWANAA